MRRRDWPGWTSGVFKSTDLNESPFDHSPSFHAAYMPISGEHRRVFIAGRKREQGVWLAPPRAWPGVVVDHAQSFITKWDTKEVAYAAYKALETFADTAVPEVLLCIPRLRRSHAAITMQSLWALTMHYPKEKQRVLLWWAPPLSNSAEGPTYALFGEPDMIYLMHGLEEGFPAGCLDSYEAELLPFSVTEISRP